MTTRHNRGRQCWALPRFRTYFWWKQLTGRSKNRWRVKGKWDMEKQTAESLASLTLKGNIRSSLKQSLLCNHPHPAESSTRRTPAPTSNQPSVPHADYRTSHSQLFSHRASHSSTQGCLPKAGCLRATILRMQCATESSVKLVKHPDSWVLSPDTLMWWVGEVSCILKV